MEAIQEIQQFYDSLIQQLEKSFEDKLLQLNKRYHVMESQMKQKVKQLEAQKNQKKEDVETMKLKAKIFSLEKQIQQLESRDHILHKNDDQIQEVQSSQEIFQNILESISKQLGHTDFAQFLYPQIDILIPNLIEILPTQMCLLSDLILLAYKHKFYPNFLDNLNNKALQEERLKLKTLEQHVNEVMFSGGCHQDFEVCFNPITDQWKKLTSDKEIDHVQLAQNCIKVTQSVKVQNQIIKLAKQKLETTFIKIIREHEPIVHLNFYQQLKQSQTLIERLDLSLLIIMISSSKEEIIIALNNLIADFNIENPLLSNHLFQRFQKKDLDHLFALRIKDFHSDREIIYNLITILKLLNKKNINLYETKNAIEHLVSRDEQLLVLFLEK